MMFGLGPVELGILVLIVLIVFGVGKLSQLCGAVGKSVRDFRNEVSKSDDPPPPAAPRA